MNQKEQGYQQKQTQPNFPREKSEGLDRDVKSGQSGQKNFGSDIESDRSLDASKSKTKMDASKKSSNISEDDVDSDSTEACGTGGSCGTGVGGKGKMN